MSGIVGIVNLDGAPVDRALLKSMTRFMNYRGPDAQEVWCEGNVGFGHTMLRTTFEAENERQPLSFDGQVWLMADARVDGRDELIDKLAAKGRDAKNANDAELILHAYHVWGEDCVAHLIGDFTFAIWDGPRCKLFCARDQFGIKLFYYGRVGHMLIISNTLNCMRQHPSISDTLNEQAIGDFLVSGDNLDLTTTAFADIARLPPAHVFSYADGVLEKRCYWQLTADDEVRYRRASDYVEHFKELLATAVADRMRMRQISIMMTGGLDSTTIAATAHDLASKGPEPVAVGAHTIVCDWLIPDRERYYSQVAAEALGIPISYLASDNHLLYKDWAKLTLPEPSDEPLRAILIDILKQMAAGSRVALTGWDGDGLLREVPRYYFKVLLKHGRLGRLGLDIGRYILAQGQLPAIGLRTGVKRFFGISITEEKPEFPRWLNKDFAARLNLKERWAQAHEWPAPSHPRRPTAFATFTSRAWVGLFQNYDPGVTGVPLEMRHPLFDLRLMNYLLSLPPVPWCISKELLRVAARGVLPEEVRLRPKTPLAGDIEIEQLKRAESAWVDQFEPTPRLAEYVERALIPQLAGESDAWAVATNTRPLSLNYWLECLT